MIEFLESTTYTSIINTLTAIGTVGSVICSLFFSLRTPKTNLNVSAEEIRKGMLVLIIKNNSLFSTSFSEWECCYFSLRPFADLIKISNPTANSPTKPVQAKSEEYAFIKIENIAEAISRKNPKFARLQLRRINLYFITQSGEEFKVKITKKIREDLWKLIANSPQENAEAT